jgi:hypothetical protein
MAFYFWTRPIGACKKKRKTTPNQRGIFGALQTNVVKFLRKSIDHQKWAHGKTVKNHPKSNIITLKAPKKKPYKIHFFKHSKNGFFISGSRITIYDCRKSKAAVECGERSKTSVLIANFMIP